MFKKIFFTALFSVYCYAGAAFESSDYLIWISSSCPVGSTTCRNVGYKHTNKKTGESVEIKGGDPIVGSLTGGLIGYRFSVPNSLKIFEVSLDLQKITYLYIRDNYMILSKEKVERISDSDYQSKLSKIKTKK